MRVEPGKTFGSRECPSCATAVAANENRCPICGYEFPNANPRQRGMKHWGALLMLLLLLALLLSGLLR